MPTQNPRKFHPLEIQAKQTIHDYAMLAPGDAVLVAVSGGADSTALLHLLVRLSAEYRLSLAVAHLNHGMRGAEGDADAAFVQAMSLELGLPFFSETIAVKQQATALRQNLEELARNLRYEFLRKTAARIGATRIAAGHNLNDQAETALFRFLRGSGLEGLSAIHPVVDGLIVRPLLRCSRETILDYLSQRHISYREDSTNADLQFTRNRIRRELIPYLQTHFNPQIIEILAREADLAREAWSFMETQTSTAWASLYTGTEEEISVQVPMLLNLHPALQKQVLRHALRKCLGSLRGVSSVHIRGLLSLCKTNGSGDVVHLPQGGTALRQFDSLILRNCELKSAASYDYTMEIPGHRHVPEAAATFCCRVVETPSLLKMKEVVSHQAFLNIAPLSDQLRIRSRMPGDRYGGAEHRKVKKMLIDRKIPLLQRDVLPMLVAGNDIVWIPGFRPAKSYAANPASGTCLMVEMSK